jgi:hypothetical protein
MKLEANIEAVILRQSEQWQRNVPTRPGPSVGYSLPLILVVCDPWYQGMRYTHKGKLYGAAIACSCCLVLFRPTVICAAG